MRRYAVSVLASYGFAPQKYKPEGKARLSLCRDRHVAHLDTRERRIGSSFTQININADDHSLMKRFHKPGDGKRSLVIFRPKSMRLGWVVGVQKERGMLRLFPVERMRAEATVVNRKKPEEQAR